MSTFDPQNPAPGVYEDLSFDIYKQIQAVNKSSLDHIETHCPAMCKHRMENPEDETEALRVGHAFHTLTLEGREKFDTEFVVADRCSAKKKDGVRCDNDGKYLVGGDWLCGTHVKKDRHDAGMTAVLASLAAQGFVVDKVSQYGSQYLSNPDGRLVRVSNHAPSAVSQLRLLNDGRESIRVDLSPYGSDDPRGVLTPTQFKNVEDVRNGILRVEECRMFIGSPGKNELTLVWVDAETELFCKARVDMWRPSWEAMGDLKTTTHAGPLEHQFSRSIKDYGYHRQSAFYLDGAVALGLPAKYFAIFPVEKEAPHTAGAYMMGPESVDLGRSQIRRNLNVYAACKASGIWPGYANGLPTINVPSYEIRKEIKFAGAA